MHVFTFKVKRQRIKCMSKYPDFPSIPFTLKKAKESNACLNILISHQFRPSDCDLDQNKMLIYKKNITPKSVI
jgi:hypothetical protein